MKHIVGLVTHISNGSVRTYRLDCWFYLGNKSIVCEACQKHVGRLSNVGACTDICGVFDKLLVEVRNKILEPFTHVLWRLVKINMPVGLYKHGTQTCETDSGGL